ncbi:hypothetical protein QNN03_23185 [Streptomyces sp. GXMU-J15]|uniref:Secreted protein n=1 Tax=Streptomyces fuscus TaxID=3048495 RepID=A0ABT7J731_9ACTN|nr:hypothetical protein [Streptomyces fuscus]MDL2079348.1 hypothetical protein [Streptomyces fuscus]
MTHRDIALLLAEAADGVEIGIAPTQTVIRRGRRRRARRWAVAAVTAVVIAGSTGALAVTGAVGGRDDGQVATGRVDLTSPQRTRLASGTDRGRDWWVSVDVWPAPRDEAEARIVWDALAEQEGTPKDAEKPSDLIGTVTYFVKRTYGVETTVVLENRIPLRAMAYTADIPTAAIPLAPDTAGPERLVIGQVLSSAQDIKCLWKDGTATEVRRTDKEESISADEGVLRGVQGSPVDMFVCLAPEDTAFKTTESQIFASATDASQVY